MRLHRYADIRKDHRDNEEVRAAKFRRQRLPLFAPRQTEAQDNATGAPCVQVLRKKKVRAEDEHNRVRAARGTRPEG